jgi:hypothetical protein
VADFPQLLNDRWRLDVFMQAADVSEASMRRYMRWMRQEYGMPARTRYGTSVWWACVAAKAT